MLLQEYKINFLSNLSPIYGKDEVQQFFYILCESILKLSRIEVSLNYDYTLTEGQLTAFKQAEGRLLKSEPIQYIVGNTYFYGSEFNVNEHTLIPRPETEELVEWVLKDHKENLRNYLDIGTGTGCIAVSLAKNLPNNKDTAAPKVTAIDFSAEALKMANLNADANKVAIDFLQLDILEQERLDQSYDVIVSNPPYVRDLEKKEMHANVLDFEPASALFVPESDPLLFYRKIAQLIKNSYPKQEKTRYLYFEINEYLATETKDMLEQYGFKNIEIKNDFRGKPRMIKALWNI